MGSSIASQAILQLCERIFTTTEISRIYNPVTELNVRSIRVMENCGFTKVAELNDSVFHEGGYVDEWVYEKVKKEQ
ncbi:GNAT family N-acetyltransferase [Pseudoalteromonas phenolica]|uniref:GNAT family N-acetyltransferase n=1 Tax=Pseudoalteromonas phenolica TaxID=161398 RepID=UPI003D357760